MAQSQSSQVGSVSNLIHTLTKQKQNSGRSSNLCRLAQQINEKADYSRGHSPLALYFLIISFIFEIIIELHHFPIPFTPARFSHSLPCSLSSLGKIILLPQHSLNDDNSFCISSVFWVWKKLFCFLYGWVFSFSFCFWGRVLCSLGWPWTLYKAKDNCELLILLFLISNYWQYKGTPPGLDYAILGPQECKARTLSAKLQHQPLEKFWFSKTLLSHFAFS